MHLAKKTRKKAEKFENVGGNAEKSPRCLIILSSKCIVALMGCRLICLASQKQSISSLTLAINMFLEKVSVHLT